MKQVTCAKCGVIIENAYGRTKYCKPCAKIVQRETLKKYQESQKTAPTTINCALCGKEVKRTSSNQKYCAECRETANREQQATYKHSMCGARYKAKATPAKAKSKKPINGKIIQGEFKGQAFYPFVTVVQPKTTLTYNQVKQLADKNGVSYAKQAMVMGVSQ